MDDAKVLMNQPEAASSEKVAVVPQPLDEVWGPGHMPQLLRLCICLEPMQG